MTGKRFIVIDDGFDFMVRDIVTGDDLIDADGVADVLNDYEKENKHLKRQIECQEEGIVDAIDSLMELPSATIYLLKQWIDAFEEYDSIEDMKNTFSERIKELEE